MKAGGKRVLLFALLLAGLAAVPVYANKQDIENAKKKVTAMEQEKSRMEESLKGLEQLKSDAAAYVKKLDGQMEQLNREMEALNQQIALKEEDIAAAQKALEAAKEREAAQYQDMKLRIKYMYERGQTSYLELLMESDSVLQMMNRAEYIRKISDYDREKLREYEESRNAVIAQEAGLREEHGQLLALREQTAARQASVERLLSEKSRELKNFDSQIRETQGQISEYEKDLKAQEAAIKRLEEELRRKEEEAKKAAEAAGQKYKTTSLGDISFIWPCPSSRRVTSEFGDRESPTEGASTNHQGMDIGASTGSAIVASAAGTVVISTYSYSAGNYIMLNHGGGVYTVYMHCSKLLVSEGASVKQGQTIAKVGSTGYSTGPHLHFGIRAGGKYVNPRKHVSP